MKLLYALIAVSVAMRAPDKAPDHDATNDAATYGATLSTASLELDGAVHCWPRQDL